MQDTSNITTGSTVLIAGFDDIVTAYLWNCSNRSGGAKPKRLGRHRPDLNRYPVRLRSIRPHLKAEICCCPWPAGAVAIQKVCASPCGGACYAVNLGAQRVQFGLKVVSVLLVVRVVTRLHRHFPHPLQNILDLFMRPFGGVQQRLPVQCIANGLISAPNVSGKAGGNGDTRGIIGS